MLTLFSFLHQQADAPQGGILNPPPVPVPEDVQSQMVAYPQGEQQLAHPAPKIDVRDRSTFNYNTGTVNTGTVNNYISDNEEIKSMLKEQGKRLNKLVAKQDTMTAKQGELSDKLDNFLRSHSKAEAPEPARKKSRK